MGAQAIWARAAVLGCGQTRCKRRRVGVVRRPVRVPSRRAPMPKAAETLEPCEVDEKRVGNLYSKTDILKAMAEYYSDALPKHFEERHLWSYVRIGLCFCACLFGCYAQFVAKWQDRLVLVICVIGYFLFNCIATVLEYAVMKNSVMSLTIDGAPVFLDLDMKSFSKYLILSLRKAKRIATRSTDVATLFDSDGVLCQENAHAEFVKVLEEYRAMGKTKKT
eukprot:NODE_2293_length_960_cov_280.321547.p1 GENE.NODE_2293_length_960_cov_280.321547~~NODE_2293_length_960_cov_280.321547.p1  ORF type:complete len:221 (+),score=77.71 NODE_2293_length_960_cov_280.321547:3-665(+)